MSIEFTVLRFNYKVLDYQFVSSERGQYWNMKLTKTKNVFQIKKKYNRIGKCVNRTSFTPEIFITNEL